MDPKDVIAEIADTLRRFALGQIGGPEVAHHMTNAQICLRDSATEKPEERPAACHYCGGVLAHSDKCMMNTMRPAAKPEAKDDVRQSMIDAIARCKAPNDSADDYADAVLRVLEERGVLKC